MEWKRLFNKVSFIDLDAKAVNFWSPIGRCAEKKPSCQHLSAGWLVAQKFYGEPAGIHSFLSLFIAPILLFGSFFRFAWENFFFGGGTIEDIRKSHSSNIPFIFLQDSCAGSPRGAAWWEDAGTSAGEAQSPSRIGSRAPFQLQTSGGFELGRRGGHNGVAPGYPPVNVYKKLWKAPAFLMGKLTILMAIFNSNVKLPEGNRCFGLFGSFCFFKMWTAFHRPTKILDHFRFPPTWSWLVWSSPLSLCRSCDLNSVKSGNVRLG